MTRNNFIILILLIFVVLIILFFFRIEMSSPEPLRCYDTSVRFGYYDSIADTGKGVGWLDHHKWVAYIFGGFMVIWIIAKGGRR